MTHFKWIPGHTPLENIHFKVKFPSLLIRFIMKIDGKYKTIFHDVYFKICLIQNYWTRDPPPPPPPIPLCLDKIRFWHIKPTLNIQYTAVFCTIKKYTQNTNGGGSSSNKERKEKKDYRSKLKKERKKEMFYLTTHSTHFIYGYMASDIWLRTILIVKKEYIYIYHWRRKLGGGALFGWGGGGGQWNICAPPPTFNPTFLFST